MNRLPIALMHAQLLITSAMVFLFVLDACAKDATPLNITGLCLWSVILFVEVCRAAACFWCKCTAEDL